MIEGECSIVKACTDYFGSDPHGRKLTIPEFKDLTQVDRVELRELLIAEGYTILELKTA